MKVVLRIFIPLCIFSFIAFGISVMFLGTQPITADAAISELTISDSGANTYDITDSFTSIRADIGAYKLTIKPWSENKTQVTVSGDKSSRIKAGVSGDRLTIESDWSWGENWNWSMFRNIFNGSAFSTEVLLKVPDKTYEQVMMYVGSWLAGLRRNSGERHLPERWRRLDDLHSASRIPRRSYFCRCFGGFTHC